MVLGLVAYRVPHSGARRTGRYSPNSSGTVLLPYPGSFTQGVLLAGCDPGKRASGTSCPGTLRLLSIACGWMAAHRGTQCVAAVSGPKGPRYRVDRSQATENHGRT